jgi:hypothetical protein
MKQNHTLNDEKELAPGNQIIDDTGRTIAHP